MADDATPFDKFNPESPFYQGHDSDASQEAPAADTQPATPFDQFNPDSPHYKGAAQEPQTTALGAFATHAAMGVVPAAAGLAGAGAGAELGSALGLLGGPAAPFTVPAGAILGGLAGAFAGGWGASKAQDYAIEQLPDDYKDPLKETLAAQEKQHPNASFTGGLVPYALTMSPYAPARALPENATNLQRLMANPATERLFSGAIVGGQELGSELANGDSPDWTKTALATGFGMMFARPNKFGETIINSGARAGRNFTPEYKPPTIMEANDLGVLAPNEVFMGSESPNRNLARSAADARSAELSLMEPEPQRSIHDVARDIDPYVFEKRDDLVAREQELTKQLENVVAPPPEALRELNDQRITLQTQLDEHVESQNGYSGTKDARRLRAQVRDVDRQISELTKRQSYAAAGREAPNPQVAELRSQITDVRREIYDISPNIVSAYRAASERIGSEVVPHESPEHMLALPAPEGAGATEFTEPPPRPVAPPPPAIVDDVRQKLMDAGRSPEEADAAAKLDSAYYTTLARDFGMTPEELYKSEAVNFKNAPERKGGGSFTVKNAKRTITMFADADHSTIIHEKGHEYLERMVRFAERDDAPAEFKARAQKALNWMGLKSAADLDPALTGAAKSKSTKAQEKFARGFEQYLREGVAPSRELAGVFARFKDWLSSIYQTVKGLGTPINDEIKGVFDRMLTTSPSRAVVAPESAPSLPKTLADLHELDRAHTEPADAHAAGDRIVAEVARAAKELPKEIADELNEAFEKQHDAQAEPAEGTAKPDGKTDGSGGSGGEVGGGRPLERIVAPSEAGGEQSGAVNGVGGKPVSEGGGLSAPERGNGGGRSDAGPAAPTAAPRIETGRAEGLDKLGNIRPENLTSQKDLVEAMRAVVDLNPESVAPGRVTMGEMTEAAEAMGIDAAKIDEAKLAEMFGGYDKIRVGLWSLRNAVVEQAQIVHDAMALANKTGLDGDVIKMGMEMDKHGMMMSTLSKVQAETGRTLGMSFKNLENWKSAANLGEFVKENTGRTLYQLKQIAKLGAGLDTPAKVGRFLATAQNRSFGRMILEYWINGLISGPATHSTYAVGNMLLAIHNATFETAAAAGIGKVRSLLGREGERVQFGEVGAKLSAGVREAPRAVEAANEALRSGLTTLLPGEQGRPTTPFQGDLGLTVARASTNEHVTWGDVGGQMFGMARGLRDGIISGAALVKAGGVPDAPAFGLRYSPLGQIPDIEIKGINALPLGSVLRAPGRAIAAIHSFFRASGYSMEVNALAYRKAAAEGLSGHDFDARVAELRQSPSEEMMEAARVHATNQTLMGQGGELVKTLSKLTNVEFNVPGLGPTPLLKFIDPFVQIASNVIEQSIVQRTPLGILAPELRATLMGKHGNVAQDMAAAKMLVGSALAISFGTLAAEGYASGSGPEKGPERATWIMAGNQAHSVRIGDFWYDTHRLGPLGMLTGIAADLYDVAHKANAGEYLEAAAHLQHAFTQNVLDESFMRGPAQLMQAIEDPGRYGANYIKNFVASFVPFSVGVAQVARGIDPYSRQARTITDAMLNKIPWGSESLRPNYDVWGQPIPARDALIEPGVTALYMTKISTDPVNLAMQRVGVFPAKLERKISNVKLTDDQYDDFARTAGVMAKERLDVLVTSPQFQQMSPTIQHNVMAEFISKSRNAARMMMMMKYPQIANDAANQRRIKRVGE